MTTTDNIPTMDELESLGFTAATKEAKRKRELARKLRIAFEHFRIVKSEHITRFNQELEKRTQHVEGKNQWGEIRTFDILSFTSIQDYTAIPPGFVLKKLREARELDCFDRFEIATIASVRVVPDPILFGIIDGCDHKHFITQWDNDVKIEDILRPDEG